MSCSHCFFKFSPSESLIEHGPGGVLIGVDHNGNKYFEKQDAQVGRDRWVVYANPGDWRRQDPSSIPPEWHGWLHGIVDANPSNVSLCIGGTTTLAHFPLPLNFTLFSSRKAQFNADFFVFFR
jgi:hypothetical protein